MKSCSDLEVDVNGQEIFLVDKKILASFSGKFNRMFAKVNNTRKNLKVILHDFPGGPRGFELLARYCYNNGRIELTPSNVVLLNCAARFMEMEGKGNLVYQTERFLEGIVLWPWHDLLASIKTLQDPSSCMVGTILDCLVQRLLFSDTSSSEMSSSPWSYDGMSSIATKESLCSTTTTTRTWWFHDLMFLNIDMVGKVVRTLVSTKLDHVTIFNFLLSYKNSKFLESNRAEKRLIVEVLVDLLGLLDKNSISCKKLFDLLRVASRLNVSKACTAKIEGLIGLRLDRATVDYLLVRAETGKRHSYDVGLVLRLVRVFLRGGECSGLKKVVWLVDLYIAEVAPDLGLGSSLFLALLSVLPDSARESHDMLYQSIDMFFEVHPKLSERKRMKVCSGLNYEKLSAATMEHMSQNSKFPSRTVVKALVAHQMKLKSSIQEAYNLKTSNDPPFVVPHYAKKLYFSSDADKYRSHLRGMHWKVMEMEKFCRLLQTNMANMGKATSRSSSHRFVRSLPNYVLPRN